MVYRITHRNVEGQKRWGYTWREKGERKVCIVHLRTRQPFRTKREVELWIKQLQEGESTGYGVTVRQLA